MNPYEWFLPGEPYCFGRRVVGCPDSGPASVYTKPDSRRSNRRRGCYAVSGTAMAAPYINHNAWPELPLAAWEPTRATLHMWTQIVGKVRLALSPHVNHWWQVPLYVTPRGLTTSPIPSSDRAFEIEFDFLTHNLDIRVND